MNAENASASIALAICGMSTAVSALSRPITPTERFVPIFREKVAIGQKLANYGIYVGGPTVRPQLSDTFSRPAIPSARAAPVDKSMQRPFTKGPRSLIRTVTLIALLGRNCDMGAEGLRAMSGSHRPRIYSFAGCGSTTAIAIMRGYACLGKYPRRAKAKAKATNAGRIIVSLSMTCPVA